MKEGVNMVEIPISIENLGIPYARRGAETSWLLNGILYIIRTIDAEYLSKVGLGLAKFDPTRKVIGYRAT